MSEIEEGIYLDEDPYGNKFYYKIGTDVFHRVNGPAAEHVDGSKFWMLNGEYHRVGGPAIEDEDGKQWWFEGKLHRLDGPAYEEKNGGKEWYYEGNYIKCESQEEFERIIKLLAFR